MSTTPATADTESGDEPLSPPSRPGTAAVSFTPRQINLIMAGLVSGMFLAALDQTIVSTAIRTIADDLNGLSIQAWATTAYLITSTITTPLYGKLSDIYGRRPFFLIAITLFVLGSALCGAAHSMYQLAAFRAFQGIGAGGLFSLALSTIGDIVPPRERAKYQGFFLAVFGTSSVLGPVVGGLLSGTPTILGLAGWRWVFLVNVPIGLLSLALVARTLHLPHIKQPQRIDYWGAAALSVGVVPLLVVAEQGRDWGWAGPRALTAYGLGVVGIVAFVVIQKLMGEAALIPLRLFRGRTFALSTVLNLLLGTGMFGALACLPLYLQIVKGKSPTVAGLLLLPLMIGIMSGSIGSGRAVARTGRYRSYPIFGLALLVVSLTLLALRVTADTSIVEVDVYGFLFGLGLGFNMQNLVVAVQNAVEPTDMGVATSSVTFFRQMGGALGTAVFLSLLFNSLPDKIAGAFAGPAGAQFKAAAADPAVQANLADQKVLQMVGSGNGFSSASLDNSSFLSAIDPRLARPFLVGFGDAIDLVFVAAAVTMLIGFVLVWFLPEEKLREKSGLEGQHAAAEAAAHGI